MIENRRCHFAEEQRLAGGPPNSHDDQVVVPEPSLSQDRILRGDVEPQCGSD